MQAAELCWCLMIHLMWSISVRPATSLSCMSQRQSSWLTAHTDAGLSDWRRYNNCNSVLLCWLYKFCLVDYIIIWFTAFSLPGQFAPRSESANRTLANSLPGTFAPWPFRSLAFSLRGLLAPWNFRSRERIGPGTFAPWNFRTREYSLPGTFAPWNFRSQLVRDNICDVSLYLNLYSPNSI